MTKEEWVNYFKNGGEVRIVGKGINSSAIYYARGDDDIGYYYPKPSKGHINGKLIGLFTVESLAKWFSVTSLEVECVGSVYPVSLLRLELNIKEI